MFERGPGARAVEVAVIGLLRLPTPERDRALRELLEAGLATRPARGHRQPAEPVAYGRAADR